ncbi:MAG: sulfotransferase [Burkholderiales bacterium]|nr:sulfotransferase [Burkholderiales bacterium]
MSLITVIGRGHSGTRAISHTLYTSNVYMGDPINASGDLLPPQAMYEACRVFARYVHWQGGLNWDFSEVNSMAIPTEFTDLLHDYLKSVFSDKSEHRGWKIPETTLIYPWLVRLYPEINYLFWVRNPRDCILGRHLTDDLADFGVEYEKTDDIRLRRAISWKYQYDIVKAVPRPAKWIEVRFEDFVLKQAETLKNLEAFLGFPLARIITRTDSIERWKTDAGVNYFDFLEPMMREYNYEMPRLS